MSASSEDKHRQRREDYLRKECFDSQTPELKNLRLKLAKQPTPELYLNYADLQAFGGNSSEALLTCQTAMQQFPKVYEVYETASRIAWFLEQYKLAWEYLAESKHLPSQRAADWRQFLLCTTRAAYLYNDQHDSAAAMKQFIDLHEKASKLARQLSSSQEDPFTLKHFAEGAFKSWFSIANCRVHHKHFEEVYQFFRNTGCHQIGTIVVKNERDFFFHWLRSGDDLLSRLRFVFARCLPEAAKPEDIQDFSTRPYTLKLLFATSFDQGLERILFARIKEGRTPIIPWTYESLLSGMGEKPRPAKIRKILEDTIAAWLKHAPREVADTVEWDPSSVAAQLDPKSAATSGLQQTSTIDEPLNLFRLQGTIWNLRYRGVPKLGDPMYVDDCVGLHHIRYLLRHPWRGVPVSQLEALLPSKSSGTLRVTSMVSKEDVQHLTKDSVRLDALLSPSAIQDVGSKIRELAEELKEARELNDLSKITTLEAELIQLEDYLQSGRGKKGRAKLLDPGLEKARKRVGNNILNAIAAIKRAGHVELARHLSQYIKPGAFCRYEPPQDETPSWYLD